MLRKLVTAQLIVLSMALSYNARADEPQTKIDDTQDLVDVDTMDADQQALLETDDARIPDIIRSFQVVCFASSGRGLRFRARGWFPQQVQREAIDRCERQTRWGHCQALGCRRGGWR